jgi:hypothetical protein
MPIGGTVERLTRTNARHDAIREQRAQRASLARRPTVKRNVGVTSAPIDAMSALAERAAGQQERRVSARYTPRLKMIADHDAVETDFLGVTLNRAAAWPGSRPMP